MAASDLLLPLALVAAFAIPAGVRARGWRGGMVAIPIAAALVPAAVTFNAFVSPAEAEIRMWWSIAVVTSSMLGLVVAGVGYAIAAYATRHDAV